MKFQEFYLTEKTNINDVKKAIKTLKVLIRKSKKKTKKGYHEIPMEEWDKINGLAVPNNPPYIKNNYSPADAKIVFQFLELWTSVAYENFDKHNDEFQRKAFDYYQKLGKYKGD